MCMLHRAIHYISQGREKRGQEMLLQAMKKDFDFVTNCIETFATAANFEASAPKKESNEEDGEDSLSSNYTFLPSLVRHYRNHLKMIFGKGILMDLMAYTVGNPRIQNPVFPNMESKISFLNEFEADLPVTPAWLNTKDFSSEKSNPPQNPPPKIGIFHGPRKASDNGVGLDNDNGGIKNANS